jgi:hypothetical protein
MSEKFFSHKLFLRREVERRMQLYKVVLCKYLNENGNIVEQYDTEQVHLIIICLPIEKIIETTF